MENLLQKINDAVRFIRNQTDFTPDYGIILGTGLGGLTQEIEVKHSFDYESIPHFPVSTVESHHGRLLLGTLGGKKIVAMAGRFHYYEGYSMQEVTFPVRVMKFLGIKAVFISNASGSLNPEFKTGHLMIVNDHINLQPEHPLRGKNYDELGPRFPDMLHTYNRNFIDKGLEIARSKNIDCHEGVYVGVQGPTLETPSEYSYMHIIGGDAVGMSTVPEVIVARHMGLDVFCISVLTDMGYPKEAIRETSLEDVINVAKEAEPKLTFVIKELITSL